jgi:aminoglycoside phosphotransferase (APT) family kinase protein
VAYELSAADGDGDLAGSLLYAKLYRAGDFPIALRKARRTRWAETRRLPPVIPLAELSAIVYTYPNDCLIDGLRIVSDPKKIQRLLYEHHWEYVPAEWRISDSRLALTTVRYKPERRAVIRCDTRAINRRSGEKRPLSAYIRIYADQRGDAVHAIQGRLFEARRDRLAVPRPIAYIRGRRLFAMETIEGTPLLDRLAAGDTCAVYAAAAAIAELHAHDDTSLPQRTIDSFLADALGSAETLGQVAPETAEAARAIVAGLTGLARQCGRGKSAFVHGDFYYGQVISQEGRAAIIDFDRSFFGEAAADIGNFCAHLRLLGLGGLLGNHGDMEREFLEAYRDRSGEEIPGAVLKFYLAYGLFQLAVGPFRRLERSWKQKTKAILDECQSVLET